MLNIYLKTAWRNLRKNTSLSLLNLGALTISLSACLVIYSWISDELSYDNSGANSDRVFRVALQLDMANQPTKHFAITAAPLAPVLVKDFPEIETAVRMMTDNPLVGIEDKRFFSDRFFYADSSFFKVFGYTLLKGDPQTVLSSINSVVINESISKKYFGDKDPIGKIITINDTTLLTVTGVAKDLPANNHFNFDVLASFKIVERLMGPGGQNAWWNDNYYTYLLLKNASDAPALNKKIAGIIDKYNAEQNKAFGLKGTHYLQALKSIHLHSNLRGELNPGGNIQTLRIFIGIAIFLLVVTCINYVNLTTATSFRRAKEIGMRKVSGATFAQLMVQFLGEAILISLVAFILALGISQLLLPFFNKIAYTQISFNFTFTRLVVLTASAIVLGIIAGIYPALYLSRVRAANTLKKIFFARGGSLSLRKVLVIFQFSLSIILIIATIIGLKQLQFMQTQDLGFAKEQVVSVQLRNQAESMAKERVKKEFLRIAGITDVTSSSSVPGERLSNILVLPGGQPQERSQTMGTLVVDHGFIPAYKLSMAAGRAFSAEFASDSLAFILNETAIKELGYPNAAAAVGKGFNWGLGKEGKIIGVVKDFHFNSLQQTVPPIVMHILPNLEWYNCISVRIPAGNTEASLRALETTWKRVLPDHPFSYAFVDETFDKQYKSEKRMGKLSAVFSILTILISCLGLFGLTMVTISQRTKEIGIRKVLGASVPGIALLVSKEFLKLVIIAIIIGSPVAWWMMNQWLQEFAYHTGISWWMFAAAGGVALLIAVCTVSMQAIKAAISNPVKNLRTE